MRFRNLAIVAVALLAVAFLGRRVFVAIQNTFHKPPVGARADKATPNEQGLFHLLEIDPVNQQNSYTYTQQGLQKMGGMNGALEADIGLWIKMGAASQSLGSGCASADNSPCAKQLVVTGQSSTGDTFPLPWKTLPDSSAFGTPTPAPMLLAMIPAGYPDTYQWVDVSVADKQGHTAKWRITHLPPSQHVLAPPVALQTTCQQGNIKATARAYRGRPAYYPPGAPMLLYDLKTTIAPATNQWELGHVTETLEWEPFGFIPREQGSTYGMAMTAKEAKFDIRDQHVLEGAFNQPLPYLKDQHFLRLTARLQQFETYDEKVTFHNVSIIKGKLGNLFAAPVVSQSVTTPSGITITLLDATTQKASEGISFSMTDIHHHTRTAISFVANVPPQSTPLTNSPLGKKYRGLLSFSIALSKPYDFAGSTQSGNGRLAVGFLAPTPLPKVIPNFTVIVRQRVDLQAVPMTFTLPIGASPRH